MNRPVKSALTPIAQALEQLLASLPRVDEQESVALDQSGGRVLAASLESPINVPSQDNSAMDGYAVRSTDISTDVSTDVSADVDEAPVSLPVVQRIPAGTIGAPLQAGEAARIFTGAPLPAGADAVVMQENCSLDGDRVTVNQAVCAGENVRPAGEDVRQGATLFPRGHRLRAQDLAVLASTGLAQVPVTRRLRITLLNTGDELVAPGTALKPGQIYNSNSYTLSALIRALGAELTDHGVIRDDPEATRKALRKAAVESDCIISTGGVSVGEEDHVKAALESLGQLDLWKLAIKPGKPFASGTIGPARFFGLPGNPVSAFITFVLMVRPCLLAMQGCTDIAPLGFPLPAGFTRDRSGERQEYLRVLLLGQVSNQTSEQPSLVPYSNQSSGVGASLSAAHGLAIIPPYTAVADGDMLHFIPFSELLH